MNSRRVSRVAGSAFILSMAGGLATACSSGNVGTSEVRSSLSRDLAPSVSAVDQSALESGNASFSFDLYGALRGTTGNLAFSPYSISSVLAMTYAGAAGTTATEIASALHFTLPPERLHPAFDWLDLQLAARAAQTAGTDARPFALTVANSLWSNPGDSFVPAFLDTLAVDYGAGINLVPFASNPAGATNAINAWTGDHTNGRILNVLPAGAVDSMTRLVLVDALYFDAGWMQPFDKNLTGPAMFTRGDGTAESVAMMRQNSTWLYGSGPGYQAVELTYDGGQVAFDLLLPASGTLDAFEASLDAGGFASLIQGMGPTSVGLTMPKSHLAGASVSLSTALEGLGIHAAFDPGAADFSGITGGRDIYVKDLFHQAFVAVDEDGTEAAAASAVVFEDAGAALPPAVSVVADHPFLFAIRDLPTGTILFLGRVADPLG